MKIYKYASIETGIKILSDQRVLLNNPKNFNDPYDSNYFIPDNYKEYLNELILNYVLFNELISLKNINGYKNDIKKLKKDKDKIVNSSFPIYTINQTIEKLLKQYSIEKQSDYHLIEESKKAIDVAVIEELDTIMNAVYVSCFSKRNDSMLMWSHYSDAHQGLCFEYEINDSNFKDVKYSETRPQNDFRKLFQVILGHIIAKKEVDYTLDIVKNPIYDVLLTKSKDWSYEKEIRCIFYENDKEVIKENNMHFYKIGIPTKIYIGCKYNKSHNLDKILQIANRLEIPVEIMKKDSTSYNIIPDSKEIKPFSNSPYNNDNLNICLREMKFAMRNNKYFSSLLLCFQIITICANYEFKNDSVKEKFKLWYEKYLYNFINIDPEIFYSLKESIIDEGTSKMNKIYGDYLVSGINLEFTLDANRLHNVPGEISFSDKRIVFNLNIRYLCEKLEKVINEKFLKDISINSIKIIDLDEAELNNKIKKL